MEKNFVPHTESLALKELGFDELVIAKYQKLSESANYQLQLLQKERNCNRLDTAISAPTFSQAFRFFRDKHNLIALPTYSKSQGYNFIIDSDEKVYFIGYKSTYEEAELKCLKKLIEIAKKGK